MSKGMELILEERNRQIDKFGYTIEHDLTRSNPYNTLINAAKSYYVAKGPEAEMPSFWPYSLVYWKPKTRLENLVRAGAFFRAAYDVVERNNNPRAVNFRKLTCMKAMQKCAQIIDQIVNK